MQFNNRLIQAPIAGYSCAAMRRLTWRWGKVDYCCSEMLSAKYLCSHRRIAPRFYQRAIDEGPLCIQLSGDNLDELKAAATQVAAWGADYLDLNCGCPMPKIRKKNCGSQLLAHSKKLYTLIRGMQQSSGLPTTIKIRVDGNSKDQYNKAVTDAAITAGASAIIVHGRHWTERYDQPVHAQQIAEIKDYSSIPVVANGDVTNAQQAAHIFHQTGCDAIMIARACVGQPWLFAKIHAELQGKTFVTPTPLQIAELFIQHIKGLIELEPEKIALLQARKLAKYYDREYNKTYTRATDANGLQHAMIKAITVEDTYTAIRKHFTQQLFANH